MKRLLVSMLLLALAGAGGCGKKKQEQEPRATDRPGETSTPAPKLTGVDMDRKVVRIGMLNDESGPGAAIGKPFAAGKRLLTRLVNSQSSGAQRGAGGFLPPGWTMELVEKDHGYNPQQAVQHYNAVRDHVLFIGTSFGTPNTLPLRPSLERDKLFAFPASLSSQMAEHEYTPPPATSYRMEARRALDFVVEQAGGADKVKAAIVYQEDDYGKDGLEGLREQAAIHGVKIVAETTVAPGQKDVTAVISTLKNAGATHVWLAALPSTTGPVLGTAHQLQYRPVWLGHTPAWLDRFFVKEVIPPEVFASFYWVTSFPYWGEKRPGMDTFVAAWDTLGKDLGEPDAYVLIGYLVGLIQVEALKRAIESGDLSREGYRKAIHSLEEFDAGGLMSPVDLSTVPYVVGKRTRVLKPVMDQKTWEVVADYAEPLTQKPAGN